MPISQYAPLYAVIGKTYGGDGHTYFNLPDMQGFAPMGQGEVPGLTPRQLGVTGGQSAVTLKNNTQLAPHTHTVNGTNATGNSSDPTNRIWAKAVATLVVQSYGQKIAQTPVVMSNSALSPAGSEAPQPHSNMQPYLGINFIMAWDGVFPARSS